MAEILIPDSIDKDRSFEPAPVPEPHVAITGIPLRNEVEIKTKTIPYAANIPVRYEISKWFDMVHGNPATYPGIDQEMHKKAWTLFILAFERFKKVTVADKRSYFQVAGIHGYPQTSWDGVAEPKHLYDDSERDPKKPGLNPHGGYCHHNTLGFGPWHRPYMLLFEQLIWEHMHTVIKGFKELKAENKQPVLTDKDIKLWEYAADTWRFPYWDWARKQKYPRELGSHAHFGMPFVFMLPYVPIFLPQNSKRTMRHNPLVQFENPEKKDGKPRKFGDMPDHLAHYNIKNYTRNKYKGARESPEVLPWNDCTATSRWGIVNVNYGDPKKTPEYEGLDGVNDYECLNVAFENMGSLFYGFRRDPKAATSSQVPDDTGANMQVLSATELEKDVYDPDPRATSLSDAVNRLLKKDYHKTWASFVTTKWYAEKHEDATGYLSLEYIHNNIHVYTGGGRLEPKDPNDPYSLENLSGLGHMSNVPVAAFDPIFWMHHGNCDRLFAMWQVLNWDKWFDPNAKSNPGREKDVKPDDALLPFRDGDGKFYTSDGVRDWVKLRYCYDDMVPKPGSLDETGLNEEAYIAQIANYADETYPSDIRTMLQVIKSPNLDDEFKAQLFGERIAMSFAEDEETKVQDYIVNVKYNRYAVGGDTYSIRLFFTTPDGQFDASPAGPQYLGEVASLGGIAPSTVEVPGCANCAVQNESGTWSRAQIPISLSLFDRALDRPFKALPSYQSHDVKEYVKQHLRCRFISAGGHELPLHLFEGTEITVHSAPIQPEKQVNGVLMSFEDADYTTLFEPSLKDLCA